MVSARGIAELMGFTGPDENMPCREVIAVVGPTASGKSELSQELALALNGAVISADSMQIYKGMDIGTGKVPLEQRKVPHFGLDIVDPNEPFSAALFQDYARTRFNELQAKGLRPILCGGTGFYVRAAIDGYEFPEGEQKGNIIRDRYNAVAEEEGPHALWLLLKAEDPASAAIIPENDTKRVVRAFELLGEGTTYAEQRERLKDIPQLIPASFIGLHVDPSILRRRIDDRVDQMMEDGLITEVENLLEHGFEDSLCSIHALGYQEIISYLHGKMTLDDAITSMKIGTHRYAKRQRTWFRKDPRIHWIDANDGLIEPLLEQSLAYIATIDGKER